MFMRSALFWDITPSRVVVVYRRFGTKYRSHLHGSRVLLGLWPVKVRPTHCPETSVNNYQTTPCNIPEELEYSSLTVTGFVHKQYRCKNVAESNGYFLICKYDWKTKVSNVQIL